MAKFIVTMCRTSYAFTDIEVEIPEGDLMQERAEEAALGVAGDYEYSEKSADYDAHFVIPKTKP
jgi:hypothetical protein